VFFDGAGGGLGDRLLVYLGGWTGSSGSVALRQRTLQRMSEDLSERIEAFRRVLERRRQLLVARFVEMERVLSQLASQVSGLERLARAG
jgi:flagellar capping protein FliD